MTPELQDKLTGLYAAYASVQAELDEIDSEISAVYAQDRINNPRPASELEKTIQAIYEPQIRVQLLEASMFQHQGGNNISFKVPGDLND